MAYRDYGEGRGGPGGGYDDRDRMDREGGRGWMDRARDYVERAREAGRDLYERERAHADRYGRGAGYGGGPDYDRGDRYDRDRYDRDGYGGGYGGSSVREGGAQGGYGGGYQDREHGRSAGSMGGNSYAGAARPDLGDRNPGQGFGAGGAGGGGGSYYGQGTPGGIPGAAQYGGRQSYAGRGSKNYRRSDARIEEEVHEVLMRHHEIDATDVDVRVENGEVTLTGEVEDRRSKRLAEEIVERLPGVRDVHNELRARRGLLGDVASAARDAVDPARPGRDRETTIGVSRGPTTGGTPSATTTLGGAGGIGTGGTPTGGTTTGGSTGGATDVGTR